WYIANGVLRVRTHADASDPTLLTVESLLELKEEVKDYIDIQVVAFPQDGIFTKKEGVDLMREALKMGVDVVGGAPHIEYTNDDGIREVELVYDLAEEFGRLIDIHIDETGDPNSRFVEVMAKESIVREVKGIATASHTTAMHNYNNDYAFKLIGNLKRAEMNMITNPFDNAVLQNRTDGYPRKRGITRVDELLERGINVSIGHDSIMDPWYSMGKGSMLQAANLLMHMGHMNGMGQIPILMDMISKNSAKTMCIEDTYGIEEGKQADLIILDAAEDATAIRLNSEVLWVIRKGRIISKVEPAKREVEFKGKIEDIDFKI
ncbi:MAG: amidohydrolase family protein, partial [Anaerovoracaceae bacterium]